MLSVKGVAEFLQVSEKTIYRWVAGGTIPHQRVGDQYRFARHEVASWAQAQGRTVNPMGLVEPEVPAAQLPRLSQALAEGGIYFHIDGQTPGGVIEEIVSIMRLPPGVDREYVRDALLARESLASTGIGDGIAIPHMRHPLPQIGVPLVSLCFLATPLDWGALDGQTVRIVFLPCCPNMRTHLHLLSRISYAVRRPAWRGLLDSEARRSDILAALESLEQEEAD